MASNFTAADVPDQRGKTFFITGANTGIGFEAAKVLAERGARVLLGCRSAAKTEEALVKIRADHPAADLGYVALDLADLASVRQAADVVAAEPRLDGLLNNAGVMRTPYGLTEDGFETQFGVNHLGHFALTGLLLPTLEKTAGSRIVITSSVGHRRGEILFDDIDATRRYHPMARYYMSKLANLLFMYELDRRLRAQGAGTIALGVHPGVSNTDLGRHMPRAFHALLFPLMFLLSAPPEGAWSTLLGATAPDAEGGQYFGPGNRMEWRGPAKQVDSTEQSKDPALAQRLWDLSVELTGVDPSLKPV
ncbi:MAG: SDR family NAD(P)-dependent oxidoreductase [Chloroflexi bacterium]|nr:SDR family NAD(P)-dependent oxidoreductase [Chloroflexota bacterium]